MVMSVLCFGCGREDMPETKDSDVLDAYVMTTEQNPRTMEEAWETANRTAIEWAEDAEVVKINSTDYLDTMDPEELTDAFMRGISDDRFSPFSETKSYSEEEWTAMMTEKYGDEWKNW